MAGRIRKVHTRNRYKPVARKHAGEDPGEDPHLKHLAAQHHALAGCFHLFRRRELALQLQCDIDIHGVDKDDKRHQANERRVAFIAGGQAYGDPNGEDQRQVHQYRYR